MRPRNRVHDRRSREGENPLRQTLRRLPRIARQKGMGTSCPAPTRPTSHHPRPKRNPTPTCSRLSTRVSRTCRPEKAALRPRPSQCAGLCPDIGQVTWLRLLIAPSKTQGAIRRSSVLFHTDPLLKEIGGTLKQWPMDRENWGDGYTARTMNRLSSWPKRLSTHKSHASRRKMTGSSRDRTIPFGRRALERLHC